MGKGQVFQSLKTRESVQVQSRVEKVCSMNRAGAKRKRPFRPENNRRNRDVVQKSVGRELGLAFQNDRPNDGSITT